MEANTVCLKLNPKIFDHLTIDSRRNKQMINGYDWMHGQPLNLKEARRMTTGIHAGEVEHKYDYSMLFADTPTWGWSSTGKQVGVWIVNPSIEYLSNGPDRVDYGGHIDLKDSPTANPTLLFIWHSFHFGGAAIAINADEEWNKVVGPFLIYCNGGPTPDAMWQDALAPRGHRKGRVALCLGKGAGLCERGGARRRQRTIDRAGPAAAYRQRGKRVGRAGRRAVHGDDPGKQTLQCHVEHRRQTLRVLGTRRQKRSVHDPQRASGEIRVVRVQRRNPR